MKKKPPNKIFELAINTFVQPTTQLGMFYVLGYEQLLCLLHQFVQHTTLLGMFYVVPTLNYTLPQEISGGTKHPFFSNPLLHIEEIICRQLINNEFFSYEPNYLVIL